MTCHSLTHSLVSYQCHHSTQSSLDDPHSNGREDAHPKLSPYYSYCNLCWRDDFRTIDSYLRHLQRWRCPVIRQKNRVMIMLRVRKNQEQQRQRVDARARALPPSDGGAVDVHDGVGIESVKRASPTTSSTTIDQERRGGARSKGPGDGHDRQQQA